MQPADVLHRQTSVTLQDRQTSVTVQDVLHRQTDVTVRNVHVKRATQTNGYVTLQNVFITCDSTKRHSHNIALSQNFKVLKRIVHWLSYVWNITRLVCSVTYC